ncbi:hypothetical protein RYX36_034877, partial [Vicia faba]
GFYIYWGCLVWVPSVYTSPGMYLVNHPVNLGTQIEASYTTTSGEIEKSLVLTSGWWGLARHFHYVPEILAAFFWTVPALFSHIASLVKSIRKLADMEEPIGQILKRTEIASLVKSVRKLADMEEPIAFNFVNSDYRSLSLAIPDKVGETLTGLVTSREAIPDLLKLDDVIDLVVPGGSNKLVSQIKDTTKIPVLGHAGNIYTTF